jgi:hypothetical protein
LNKDEWWMNVDGWWINETVMKNLLRSLLSFWSPKKSTKVHMPIDEHYHTFLVSCHLWKIFMAMGAPSESLQSMYEKLLPMFCLSHWDLPNHCTSCHALGIFRNLKMNEGSNDLVWECFNLRCGSYWLLNHFFIEN